MNVDKLFISKEEMVYNNISKEEMVYKQRGDGWDVFAQ